MRQNNLLEPVFFVVNKKNLTKKQSDNLKFLDSGNLRNISIQRKLTIHNRNLSGAASPTSGLNHQNSATSIVSGSRKKWAENPIYGHNIESIRATQSNTIVYRVRADIYNRFLHPEKSIFWGEKDLLSVLPP